MSDSESEKTGPKKVSSPVVWWEFRCNAEYVRDFEQLLKFMDSDMSYYLFQLEQGKENGYKHFQGYFSLHDKKRKSELLKLFQKACEFQPNHIAPLSKGLMEQLKVTPHCYFDKTDTRLSGPWEKGKEKPYIPSQYNLLNLYPYQSDIRDFILKVKANMRNILLIVNQIGNIGKTSLCHYLCLTYGCIYIPPVKCAKDLLQAVCDICISRKVRKIPCFFLDLPRAMNKRDMSEFAQAIEQLKAGYLYDFRNSFRDWYIECPHVVIFSNQSMDVNLLSADRWIFKTIDVNKALIDYVPNTKAKADFELEEEEDDIKEDYSEFFQQPSNNFKRY